MASSNNALFILSSILALSIAWAASFTSFQYGIIIITIALTMVLRKYVEQ